MVGTDLALARPKSASLRSPSSPMRRFCGFRSLRRGGVNRASYNCTHQSIIIDFGQINRVKMDFEKSSVAQSRQWSHAMCSPGNRIKGAWWDDTYQTYPVRTTTLVSPCIVIYQHNAGWTVVAVLKYLTQPTTIDNQRSCIKGAS